MGAGADERGSVKPVDADDKIKFFAAEDGVRRHVCDARGNCFANDSERRGTDEVRMNTHPLRLPVSKTTSDQCGWHCKQYT